VVISQPMYFPWVGMLEQMALADVFICLDDADFSKGSLFNRVQVKTSQGVQWLTVPRADHPMRNKLNEVQPASGSWRRKHLATLQQAYAAAPFLGEMLDLAESVLRLVHESLSGLGTASMMNMAGYFGMMPGKDMRSSDLDVDGGGSERVLKLCQEVGGERYVTGHGAKNYLDHEAFEAAGVRVEYMDYEKREYPQLHGEFTPYVTGLDLVANCGSAGREFIVSGTVPWREFLSRERG